MFKKLMRFVRYVFGFGFMDDFRAGQEEYMKDFWECRSVLMRDEFVNQMKKVQDEEDGQQLAD